VLNLVVGNAIFKTYVELNNFILIYTNKLSTLLFSHYLIPLK